MQPLVPTRMPDRMSSARADLDAVLDSTFLAHISFVDDEGMPVAMPTAVARWEDRLLTHGSTGSRWLRMLTDGRPVCVSVALVDGLVVARSTFESSVIYRSAMIFGAFSPVDATEKAAALDILSERLIPGRTSEVRAPRTKELAATSIFQMDIDRFSVRLNDHMPEDPDDDVAGDAWAGQIRFGSPSVEIVPAPDLRAGIAIPDSVRRFGPLPAD